MKNTFRGKIFPVFLSVILLTAYLPSLFSQEEVSCAENLRAAQSGFERGQIDQIPSLLTGCLRSGFKKEEELSAYKLLIQTYLLQDKIGLADSAMLDFLRKNPEYRISSTDHSSFVYLYNKFDVRPVFQISAKVGTSLPFLTFVDENPLAGNPGKNSVNSDLANFFLSVETKFRISSRLEAGIEAGYSSLGFTRSTEALAMNGQRISTIRYTEYQKRLEIPVSITWDIAALNRFTPYLRAGLGTALSLSSTGDASYNVESYDRLNSDRTGGTLDRNEVRSFMDFYLQAGGGVKYKIPRGYLFAVIRANLGILNQNTGNGLITAPLESWWYIYGDPYYRLNTLNFCVGYTYIFYKPSKRKV